MTGGERRGSATTPRALVALGIASLACIALTARTLAGVVPQYNWDMLAYMALALEWSGEDHEAIHREVYDAAERELPPEAYADLVTQSSAVRAARRADASAFWEHAAFYRGRVVPTLLIGALYAAGAPLAAASWWMSVGTLVPLLLLAVLWLARHVPSWLAVVAGTLLIHAPPFLKTATVHTPDLLATLVFAAGLYLLVERRARVAGSVLLVLSIATRTDSVILVGLIVMALAIVEHGRTERLLSLRALAILAAASALTYVGVERFSGHFGWWPLFQISFGAKVVHPSELATSVDLDLYRRTLAAQLDALPGDGYDMVGRHVTGTTFVFVFTAFALLGVALWRRLPRGEVRARLAPYAAILGALVAAYFVRWFLFPYVWDRMFALVYLVVPLSLVAMASAVIRANTAERDAEVATAEAAAR